MAAMAADRGSSTMSSAVKNLGDLSGGTKMPGWWVRGWCSVVVPQRLPPTTKNSGRRSLVFMASVSAPERRKSDPSMLSSADG